MKFIVLLFGLILIHVVHSTHSFSNSLGDLSRIAGGIFNCVDDQNQDIKQIIESIQQLVYQNPSDEKAKKHALLDIVITLGELAGHGSHCHYNDFIEHYNEHIHGNNYKFKSSLSVFIADMKSHILKIKNYGYKFGSKYNVWKLEKKNTIMVCNHKSSNPIKPIISSTISHIIDPLIEKLEKSVDGVLQVIGSGFAATGLFTSWGVCENIYPAIENFLYTVAACGDTTETSLLAINALDQCHLETKKLIKAKRNLYV